MSKSITVAELIAELKKQPPNFQVYTSSDPEGNGFGSLEKGFSFDGSNEDKILIIYPLSQYQDDEIMPVAMEKIRAEFDKKKEKGEI